MVVEPTTDDVVKMILEPTTGDVVKMVVESTTDDTAKTIVKPSSCDVMTMIKIVITHETTCEMVFEQNDNKINHENFE